MNCANCGAKLSKGVSFCKECGERVGSATRYCSSCGSELEPNAKFCRNCGAATDVSQPGIKAKNKKKKKAVVVHTSSNPPHLNPAYLNSPFESTDHADERHKNPLVLVLVCIILAFCLILGLFVFEKIKKNNADDQLIPPKTTEASTDHTIDKRFSYSFMSDEWNVYVAVPVSDSVVKVEHWKKHLKNAKKLKYESDLGSYKINDPENGFYWVDDEKTAFSMKISDKENSAVRSNKQVVFTINISDEDVCKGTDYDESIACYSYRNDDWHEYRAIMLTEKLMKIEVWSSSTSIEKPLFGYDWMLIDPAGLETDFEWGDDSREAFTITTQDPNNRYYWKEPHLVTFMLSNPGYKYATVSEYLGLSITDNAQGDSDLSETEKESKNTTRVEKNGFENGTQEIRICDMQFLVPDYWKTDEGATGEDSYRAYVESGEKSVMFQVMAPFDDEDTVTYDLLVKEENEGLMQKAIASWFDSCSEVSSRPYDNGSVKGFCYSTDFIQAGSAGHSESFVFPSEKTNRWFFVTVWQPDASDYSYIEDLYRIIDSIVVDPDYSQDNAVIDKRVTEKDQETSNTDNQSESKISPVERIDGYTDIQSIFIYCDLVNTKELIPQRDIKNAADDFGLKVYSNTIMGDVNLLYVANGEGELGLDGRYDFACEYIEMTVSPKGYINKILYAPSGFSPYVEFRPANQFTDAGYKLNQGITMPIHPEIRFDSAKEGLDALLKYIKDGEI